MIPIEYGIRSHVQRSWSNHSSQPTVLSAQYLLTLSLDLCTHNIWSFCNRCASSWSSLSGRFCGDYSPRHVMLLGAADTSPPVLLLKGQKAVRPSQSVRQREVQGQSRSSMVVGQPERGPAAYHSYIRARCTWRGPSVIGLISKVIIPPESDLGGR